MPCSHRCGRLASGERMVSPRPYEQPSDAQRRLFPRRPQSGGAKRPKCGRKLYERVKPNCRSLDPVSGGDTYVSTPIA